MKEMKFHATNFYKQLMSTRLPSPGRRQRRLVKKFEDKLEELLAVFPLEKGDERQDQSQEERFFAINLRGLNKKQLRKLMKKIDEISLDLIGYPEIEPRFECFKEHTKSYIQRKLQKSRENASQTRKQVRKRLKELHKKKPKSLKRFARRYFRDVIDQVNHQSEEGEILPELTPIKGDDFVISLIDKYFQD